jgi:hypothetical protein
MYLPPSMGGDLNSPLFLDRGGGLFIFLLPKVDALPV